MDCEAIGTFRFPEMHAKLCREINRLRASEDKGNVEDAMDHALNGALTGYHLLDWRAKDTNPDDNRRAKELLDEANNEDLYLLHDIVSKTKHAHVSTPQSSSRLDVTAATDVIKITVDGEPLNAGGEPVIVSWVTVMFDDESATNILQRVYDYFTPNTSG